MNASRLTITSVSSIVRAGEDINSLHRDRGRCMKMTMKEWLVAVLAVAAVCWGTTLAAQDKEAAKAALSARVSLERGLSVSASHGRPNSAKFEMEDGKLQLSVYTATTGRFFEVVVDPSSGAVIKTELIGEGEDFTARARVRRWPRRRSRCGPLCREPCEATPAFAQS